MTMQYKSYGQTGKKISVIGFGGMRFENHDDIQGNAELLLYAKEKGINYFDTAPGYCGTKSENIMGAAFKQMKRDQFYISSKSGQADGEKLLADLHTSLERLNLDYLDVFHIWCVVTLDSWQKRLAGGAIDAALKAKEQGLIKHLAVSSHLPSDQLEGVLKEAPFEGVTVGYCAINFTYRQIAVDAAGDMGLGVVTMNPLGGGLIPKNAQRFDFIRGPKDKNVIEAALRFNISRPAITSALVGFTTREHIDQACAAADNFTPYSSQHIENMQKHILNSFDNLCTGCGYCLPCPVDINIPQMMDAYDQYTLAGDNDKQHILNRLAWHWNLPPEIAATCIECGQCEDKCTQQLPIRDRLKVIAEFAASKK